MSANSWGFSAAPSSTQSSDSYEAVPVPERVYGLFDAPQISWQGVPSPSQGSDATRSENYWFSDGSVVIKVENTLYNLYKGVLIKHSEYIRLKFFPPSRTAIPKLKKGKKGKTELKVVEGVPNLQLGTLDEPLVLDIVKSDFEIFLSYVFPQDYAAQYEFALKEWTAILSIANKLEFMSIRAVAINNIQKMSSPIDLVELGRKHTISQLYNEGFRHLCHREESLSLQEGEKIGLASVIQIAHARDMLAKGSLWSELEFSIEFSLVVCVEYMRPFLFLLLFHSERLFPFLSEFII